MPVPLEFLLGMKEPAEIDRRVLVPEQLRRGGLKCVRRGEGGRNPVGGVGADGERKIGDTLGFDLEPHRRVQPAGDRSHLDKAKALWVGGARGRGATASAAGWTTPPSRTIGWSPRSRVARKPRRRTRPPGRTSVLPSPGTSAAAAGRAPEASRQGGVRRRQIARAPGSVSRPPSRCADGDIWTGRRAAGEAEPRGCRGSWWPSTRPGLTRPNSADRRSGSRVVALATIGA